MPVFPDYVCTNPSFYMMTEQYGYNCVVIFVDSMVEKTVPHVVNRGLGLRQLVSTYACPNDGEYIGKQCCSEEQDDCGSVQVATQ